MSRKLFTIIIPFVITFSLIHFPFSILNIPPVFAQTATPTPEPLNKTWPMAGANPQRTSWTAEEVKGQLYPQWYKVIEPFIPTKVQILAANNTLYLSTSRGLYAFDLNGNQKWVYPTEMPLGHSPAYLESTLGKRLYVGGLDHKIHCVNADTGALIWTYEVLPVSEANGDMTLGAGFDTNPLAIVINSTIYIYAGNRNSYEYALIDQGSSAREAWKYKASGQLYR